MIRINYFIICLIIGYFLTGAANHVLGAAYNDQVVHWQHAGAYLTEVPRERTIGWSQYTTYGINNAAPYQTCEAWFHNAQSYNCMSDGTWQLYYTITGRVNCEEPRLYPGRPGYIVEKAVSWPNDFCINDPCDDGIDNEIFTRSEWTIFCGSSVFVSSFDQSTCTGTCTEDICNSTDANAECKRENNAGPPENPQETCEG